MAKTNPKKAYMAMLLSDNRDFRERKITRNKEGHHIIIKAEIQQEDIIILNTQT